MSLPPLVAAALAAEPLDIAVAAAAMGAPVAGPGGGLALFLLGLITGVAGAILAFFAWMHLAWRSRKGLADLEAADLGTENPEESHLDAADLGDPEDSQSADPHPRPQPRMPWERPEDWWRSDS